MTSGVDFWRYRITYCLPGRGYITVLISGTSRVAFCKFSVRVLLYQTSESFPFPEFRNLLKKKLFVHKAL